jgi:hypothetical protein
MTNYLVTEYLHGKSTYFARKSLMIAQLALKFHPWDKSNRKGVAPQVLDESNPAILFTIHGTGKICHWSSLFRYRVSHWELDGNVGQQNLSED